MMCQLNFVPVKVYREEFEIHKNLGLNICFSFRKRRTEKQMYTDPSRGIKQRHKRKAARGDIGTFGICTDDPWTPSLFTSSRCWDNKEKMDCSLFLSNLYTRASTKGDTLVILNEAPHRSAWLRDWPFFLAWMLENQKNLRYSVKWLSCVMREKYKISAWFREN